MNACSLNCGYATADSNERFCPDCGAAMNAGAAAVATVAAAASAPAPIQDAAPLPMPDMPGDLVDTRPVAKTIVLPNKTEVHLREGDRFTIRRRRTPEEVADKGPDEPADFYVGFDSDAAVSASSPLVLTIENGELVAEGGGGNGYKISRVHSYKPSEKTTVTNIPGETATIVVGAKTPLRVK